MFGIGMPELVLILIIALVIFGPGKLPDLGSSLGKAIKGFKKSMDEPEKKPDDSTKTDSKGNGDDHQPLKG